MIFSKIIFTALMATAHGATYSLEVQGNTTFNVDVDDDTTLFDFWGGISHRFETVCQCEGVECPHISLRFSHRINDYAGRGPGVAVMLPLRDKDCYGNISIIKDKFPFVQRGNCLVVPFDNRPLLDGTGDRIELRPTSEEEPTQNPPQRDSGSEPEVYVLVTARHGKSQTGVTISKAMTIVRFWSQNRCWHSLSPCGLYTYFSDAEQKYVQLKFSGYEFNKIVNVFPGGFQNTTDTFESLGVPDYCEISMIDSRTGNLWKHSPNIHSSPHPQGQPHRDPVSSKPPVHAPKPPLPRSTRPLAASSTGETQRPQDSFEKGRKNQTPKRKQRAGSPSNSDSLPIKVILLMMAMLLLNLVLTIMVKFLHMCSGGYS